MAFYLLHDHTGRVGTMLDFSHPKGICFQCQRCTLCCGDTPTHVRHVLLLESEAGQISQALSKRIGEFATTVEGREPYFHEMKKTAEECKCIFLNESHCTIYAIRPLVCRFYPFELKTGANGELEFSCTRECKGIGKGRELSGTFFESLFRQAQERLVEASAKRNENNPPNR